VTDHRAGGSRSTDRLEVKRFGAGSPVALLHGFTQNSGAWGPFGEILATSHTVNAVDLPGHGGSTDLRADLWETAELAADACGPSDYIGYSFGGRVLLHAALSRPGAVRRAALIGSTAGIDDPQERAARVAADELLARELDQAVGDKDVLRAFLIRWLESPLFAGLTDDAACMSARMENSAAGLASSLRLCGTGTQESLWGRVGELDMPVLVLAGEHDERFTALGKRLAAAIGDNATFVVVPGSSHACQLARPVETAAAIEDFFSRT
jgi:2-succinyl-6-hydroxy-2,4-cyclohexadiene-1-carboxylate synthase